MKHLHFSPFTQTALAVAMAIYLAGCALGPDYKRPILPTPPTWSQPLPHQGSQAKLKDWWASWGDPVLASLIDNAQRENANVAIAAARIDQARAAYTATASPLWPGVALDASDTRSKVLGGESGGAPAGSGNARSIGSSSSNRNDVRSAAIVSSWEIDLFGAKRRAVEAANARNSARMLDWHDARVSVAAEVATTYTNLRACEILVIGYERDAASRAETARLTNLKTKAGFVAPAEAALSNASAAEAASRLTQQRADCDIEIKALSMVSVTPEIQLREKLKAGNAKFPSLSAAAFSIDSVPALALAQRPDVGAAERELAAASGEIGAAEADRYPSITLTGSIGYSANNFSGTTTKGSTWSYGPSVRIPFFDAGRAAANADAARARYAEALASYKGKTARAVREVEEALVRINSATNREADANAALKGYEIFLGAANARVRTGAGSLVELEEARRSVVASQGAAVAVERERINAWISLYRAVGGGWDDIATSKSASAPTSAPASASASTSTMPNTTALQTILK